MPVRDHWKGQQPGERALVVAERSKGGRPTECSPELAHRISMRIRNGQSLKKAAMAENVRPNTAQEWVVRGLGMDDERPATETYTQFAIAVMSAAGEFEARIVRRIALLSGLLPPGEITPDDNLLFAAVVPAATQLSGLQFLLRNSILTREDWRQYDAKADTEVEAPVSGPPEIIVEMPKPLETDREV